MTGYTSELVEKDLDLKHFTLMCARAFGACFHMRDEPISVLPKPNTELDKYTEKEIKKDSELLSQLRKLRTKKSKIDWATNQLKTALAEAKKFYNEANKSKEKQKLKNMKLKVSSWEPPTASHQELKNFMLSQLESSMQFGDNVRYYKELVRTHEKDLENPLEYYKQEVKQLISDISYNKKKYKKEVEAIKKCNKWIKDLYNSFGEINV